MNNRLGAQKDKVPWPIAFGQLTREVNQYLLTILAKRGYSNLTMAQLYALYQLRNGMTSSELVHLLGISKQGVSSLVISLQLGGYLKSQPSKTDHRCTLLFLTEQGTAIQEEVERSYSHCQALVKEQLGHSLYRLLSQEVPALLFDVRQILKREVASLSVSVGD